MKHEFLERSVQLAINNVNNGGEPFGAVVVKNGQIVGEGVNRVKETNDPTAHAEIEAIRKACQHLETTDLSDCELYASGEPCPMCLSTIYWANFKKVYIGFTIDDAAKFGLSSAYFYEQLKLPKSKRDIQMTQKKLRNDLLNPYQLWKEKQSGER